MLGLCTYAGSLHYFRLKQVDTGGPFEYSKVILVAAAMADPSLYLYPTAGGAVKLRHPIAVGSEVVTVFSVAGVKLL